MLDEGFVGTGAEDLQQPPAGPNRIYARGVLTVDGAERAVATANLRNSPELMSNTHVYLVDHNVDWKYLGGNTRKGCLLG